MKGPTDAASVISGQHVEPLNLFAHEGDEPNDGAVSPGNPRFSALQRNFPDPSADFDVGVNTAHVRQCVCSRGEIHVGDLVCITVKSLRQEERFNHAFPQRAESRDTAGLPANR